MLARFHRFRLADIGLPSVVAAELAYGDLRADLERRGQPIGALSTMMPRARCLDAVLLTNNTREFERVAGLKLENWAE